MSEKIHGPATIVLNGTHIIFEIKAGYYICSKPVPGPQPTPTDLPEFTVATNPSDSEIAGPRE